MRGGMRLRAASAAGPDSDGAQLRRQRNAHARLAIAVAETTQLELGHRDEVTHPVPAPDKLLRIDGEGERAKGQALSARREDDAVTLGRG